MAAAAALDAGVEDPSALQAAADALDVLLPLDDALEELAALQAAVDTLQAAAATDAYVPTALDDLAAVRAVAANVTGIAGQLRALQVRAGGSWQGLLAAKCACSLQASYGSLRLIKHSMLPDRLAFHPSCDPSRATTAQRSRAWRGCCSAPPASTTACCCCPPTAWARSWPCCGTRR